MTQRPTGRCECGRVYLVTATASRYEFEWRCLCGRAGSISHAHSAPPPQWTGGQRTFTFTDASSPVVFKETV